MAAGIPVREQHYQLSVRTLSRVKEDARASLTCDPRRRAPPLIARRAAICYDDADEMCRARARSKAIILLGLPQKKRPMRLQIIGFILTLVVGVLAAPLAAEAPPAGKMPVFGHITRYRDTTKN